MNSETPHAGTWQKHRVQLWYMLTVLHFQSPLFLFIHMVTETAHYVNHIHTKYNVLPVKEFTCSTRDEKLTSICVLPTVCL